MGDNLINFARVAIIFASLRFAQYKYYNNYIYIFIYVLEVQHKKELLKKEKKYMDTKLW